MASSASTTPASTGFGIRSQQPMVDPDDVVAFVETAQQLRRRLVDPMVGVEGRDGQLDRLGSVLDGAESVGILATADPSSAGHEYGIWGTSCLEEGAEVSLRMLEEVAAGCAGVAMCLHVAGLGALELAGTDHAPRRAAAALFEPRPVPEPSNNEATFEAWLAAEAVTLSEVEGGPIVDGAKRFVYAAPDTEAFVVFVAGPAGAERVLLAADTEGLTREPIESRTGLAACRVLGLTMRGARVGEGRRLAGADPSAFARRLWLGIGAIAVGNARGALEVARSYALDRYQGGRQIWQHPAVQLLLGSAEARIRCGAGSLIAEARDPSGDLRGAAMLKARLADDAAKAVSDCLQVLGGYGYMEDYRVEKRLRDALTLKSALGRPDDLIRLVALSAPRETP